MSNARTGRAVKRTDPTRTKQAKAATLAAKAARAAKRPATVLDTERLTMELAR